MLYQLLMTCIFNPHLLKGDNTLCRYDVELYQRIEALIGKKLPLYPTVEEEVLALMERVAEAQRHVKMVGGASGCGQL